MLIKVKKNKCRWIYEVYHKKSLFPQQVRRKNREKELQQVVKRELNRKADL